MRRCKKGYFFGKKSCQAIFYLFFNDKGEEVVTIKEDIQVRRYKARQLMKKLGLKPRYPKRFKVTTDSDHNEAISPNLLNRQFDVATPNKVWTTDITYVWALKAGSTSRSLLIYFPGKW